MSRITRSLEDIVPIQAPYEPGRYRARLAFALTLSLLIHAFVLSLRFGVAGLGLPGVAPPWAERRAFSSDLSVRLADASRAHVAPAAPRKIEPARSPAARAPRAARPPAVRTPAVRPPAKPVLRTPPTRAKRRQARAAPKPAAPAVKPAMQPRVQPELIAQPEPQQETFSAPPPTPGVPEPVPAVAATQLVEEPLFPVKEPEQIPAAAEKALAEEENARRAREQEAARLEQARMQEEARKQEEAARLALELEALKQAEETARQQAAALARQRALELEASRQEEVEKQEEATAARLALEFEALKQAEEAARQQAAVLARQRELEAKKQAEELAARERAAQELAERQSAEALAASQRQRETERIGAAPSRVAPAAEPGRSTAGTIGLGTLSGRELAAKALGQLRTPEAGRAELQGPPRQSPQSPSGAERPRRGSILGSAQRDIGFRMYVESWRWKIERNGNLNYPSGARTRAAENPVVTVAIRRDGSVESVIIDRSSGQRDLDERVRRIVQLYAPYSAFPPDLARAYDVIEIRLVWIFANTLRIVEELR